MKLTAGNKTILARIAREEPKVLQGGAVACLQIVCEKPLKYAELDALLEGPITAEDGRVFEGYSALDSVSILLYRPTEALKMQREIEARDEQMRQMVALMPDEAAKAYVHLVRGMAYDGATISKGQRINWNGVLKRARQDLVDVADCAPSVRPQLWEDI